jgi:PAS domain S-box-containing protein
VLEYAPSAIAILDREMRYLMINERFREDFELGDLDVVGLNHFEVFTGLADRWKAVCRRCLGGAVERGKDDPIEWREGMIEYVCWECRPWRDQAGEIGGVVLLFEVVTDRKLAEERIRESERRLGDIINFLPDATFVVDNEGRVIAWNKAIEELTKISASEMVGKKDYEYAIPFYGEKRPLLVDCAIHPELLFGEYYASIEREGAILVAELCLPHFQGRPTTYFWGKATPLYDLHGNLIGGIETLRDTTDRKLAEEEVRQLNEKLEKRVAERTRQLEISNKELEAFSYSVSHDLRAPLRSINGFSQILLDEYRDSLDESGRDYLSRIVAAGQRMGQLIEDLLGLSRVTRREMVRTRVDLSEVVRSVLAELTAGTPDRRVELIISPGIEANGDPGLLRIVMENLLGNAWKFTSHHTTARIEFGMRLRGNRPEYFVRDDGAGFDMKTAEKLFAPFQRLHRAEDFPGAGIGLATVQRIIHRHEGRIWAEGELEKGATFYFTLGS